eukprot:scaffold170627_cov20-Tisochrysis_lutea.AAC.2
MHAPTPHPPPPHCRRMPKCHCRSRAHAHVALHLTQIKVRRAARHAALRAGKASHAGSVMAGCAGDCGSRGVLCMVEWLR